MASRDEDFGADLALTEGNDATWSPSGPAPARDWRSLYEQAHARADRERSRADAAEARCEELRWAEVASRTDAGSWKSRFRACRSKLTAAEEETKELRRAAKDMPALQAEVALLSEEGIEWKEDAATETLRKENARLRRALAAESREDAIGPRPAQARRLRAAETRAEERKDTIKALRAERGELRKEVTRLNPCHGAPVETRLRIVVPCPTVSFGEPIVHGVSQSHFQPLQRTVESATDGGVPRIKPNPLHPVSSDSIEVRSQALARKRPLKLAEDLLRVGERLDVCSPIYHSCSVNSGPASATRYAPGVLLF